jgi:hypothetical protein
MRTKASVRAAASRDDAFDLVVSHRVVTTKSIL